MDIHDNGCFLSLELGGSSEVMGYKNLKNNRWRFTKWQGVKKRKLKVEVIVYKDAKYFNGFAVSEFLPYDYLFSDNGFSTEARPAAPVDADAGRAVQLIHFIPKKLRRKLTKSLFIQRTNKLWVLITQIW